MPTKPGVVIQNFLNADGTNTLVYTSETEGILTITPDNKVYHQRDNWDDLSEYHLLSGELWISQHTPVALQTIDSDLNVLSPSNNLPEWFII